MTSDDGNDPANDRQALDRAMAEAGRVAEARSVLAAIDRSVFSGRTKPSRAEHRLKAVRTVAGLFEHG